jgi:hypothetical protein
LIIKRTFFPAPGSALPGAGKAGSRDPIKIFKIFSCLAIFSFLLHDKPADVPKYRFSSSSAYEDRNYASLHWLSTTDQEKLIY